MDSQGSGLCSPRYTLDRVSDETPPPLTKPVAPVSSGCPQSRAGRDIEINGERGLTC